MYGRRPCAAPGGPPVGPRRAARPAPRPAIARARRLALLTVAYDWSLGELRAALERAPRTVLLQWTLIEGVNDDPADADALARFCEGLDVRVNLIPLNP